MNFNVGRVGSLFFVTVCGAGICRVELSCESFVISDGGEFFVFIFLR